MDSLASKLCAVPGGRVAARRRGDGLEIVPAGHPDRGGLEGFIADVYARAYGAEVRHFARTLVGLRRADGQWRAAVGYTLAGPEPLFLEQYLDQPIQSALTERVGVSVRREEIVEAGNLAAAGAGDARQIIARMTVLLHRLGRSWVVLTLTKALLNSFARLDIHPIAIARADPARLPDGGATWGTYYASDPRVMAASIPLGYARLAVGGNDAP